MRFGLSDEQKMFDDAVRAELARALPIERLRKLHDEAVGYVPELHQALCGQGLAGICIPEKFGGSGLGLVEAVVAAEALGHAAAPFAFAGGAVMAPLAILRSGDDQIRQELLPLIATGERRVGVDFSTRAGVTGMADLQLSGRCLSGSTVASLDCAGATDLLIALPNGCFALAATDSPGISLTLRPTVDRARPLAAVTFDNAEVRVLDQCDDAISVTTEVLAAGRLMLAADSLGAGQRMIDKAVAYAGEREQFGRTIGSFQAVKHICAELVGMLEPCRALIWYAAFASQHGQDDGLLNILHAKSHLGEVTRDVARMATEVHGGMGFTDLLGLHLWFKRITFDRQALGGPEQCRREAAALQGWMAA